MSKNLCNSCSFLKDDKYGKESCSMGIWRAEEDTGIFKQKCFIEECPEFELKVISIYRKNMNIYKII